jgi:hypothetical protein
VTERQVGRSAKRNVCARRGSGLGLLVTPGIVAVSSSKIGERCEHGGIEMRCLQGAVPLGKVREL